MRRAARLILPFALLLLTRTSPGSCADLSISGQVGGPGASVLMPVSFDAHGKSVSGLQFDLIVDHTVLSLAPVVGDATRTSGQDDLVVLRL